MHGGDIYRNQIELDFSINVNPLGMPPSVEAALKAAIHEVEHYPDLLCEKLSCAIANHHRVEAGNVLCANGASELIHAICNAIKPKRALLVAPGFSGYLRALQAVASQIHMWNLSRQDAFVVDERFVREIEMIRPDIVFLTNPNNPTGRMVAQSVLGQVVQSCKAVGAFLVLDECFLELTQDGEKQSYISQLQDDENVMILRAFTKSFAIPGVRLGYAICKNDMWVEGIREQLPDWNVSVLAQRAGLAAMQEEKYLARARDLVTQERDFLIEQLTKAGMQVFASDANYLLFYDNAMKQHIADGVELYEALKKRQILIRDCKDYEGLEVGFYRVAVRTHTENEQLIEAINEVLKDEKH